MNVDLAPETYSGLSVPGAFFILISAWFLFTLPSQKALLPMFMTVLFVPRSQLIDLGPMSFPLIRILILVGFLRVMSKGERIAGRLNILDRIMIVWGVWAIASSAFHPSGLSMTRCGDVYTDLGIYFLGRVFIRGLDDVRIASRYLCILLVPVAVGMLMEKMSGSNTWAHFWGESSAVMMRHDAYRARGPFVHPILAGTVGASILPLAFCLWKEERKTALMGLAAAGAVVYASGSSGPIMTAAAIFGALFLWKFRDSLRAIRWMAVGMIVILDLVMNDPVYYLVARLDVSSGSTGWYRAYLIQCALEHMNEWWLVGTDFTRHWMPRGLGGSETSADITNHFIEMAVWGGLPLMLLFTGALLAAFSLLGKTMRQCWAAPLRDRFLIWTLGAILFGHAVTFLSVTYFDPPVILLFHLLLAAIASVYAAAQFAQAESAASAPEEAPVYDAGPESLPSHG